MKILFIGRVWPEPTSSAAGVRTRGFVDRFLREGWDVTFQSSAHENHFSEQLRELGVQVISMQPNDSRSDAFLLGQSFDVVWFDTFIVEEQFGWRVRERLPKALRVLDTQDLHFLRRTRQSAIEVGRSIDEVAQCQLPLKKSKDLLRELGSILRSDLSLILSDFERRLLIDHLGVSEDLLLLSRFSYLPGENPVPSFRERSGVVFIGNDRHPPNRDGLHWLVDEIWPKVHQKLPSVLLRVIGAYPSKETVTFLSKQPGIEFVGPIPDVFQELSRARLNLAPLRFGAGIKGKISDGFFVGTPVVSTSIGAEGMHGGLSWPGAVTNDPELFSEALIRIYENQTIWEEASSYCIPIMNEIFSMRNQDHVFEAIVDAREKLEERRGNNLLGRLLQFHEYERTKYFSKWIEAKNESRYSKSE